MDSHLGDIREAGMKTLSDVIRDRMEIYKAMEEDQKKADDMQVGGSHYKDMPVQPWTVMQAVLSDEEFRGFLKGNIIKYAMRQGRKDGSDDAGKLQHYLQKLHEVDTTWP
jgi:hypothetical protein